MKTHIQIPTYMDDKSCLLHVHTTDSDMIHQSWLLDGDRVICYEYIPQNYPSGSMCVWDHFDDYVNAIADVYWLNDPEYILNVSEDLEEVGFPFLEDEEEPVEGIDPVYDI